MTGMMALLVLARLKNWDWVIYPHPSFSGPAYFFWFTFPAGLIAIAMSMKAIYDRARTDVHFPKSGPTSLV